MKTLETVSRQRANDISKLNFKHCGSTRCNVECLTKFLQSDYKKYHRPYPLHQGSGKLKRDPVLNLVDRKQKLRIQMEAIKYKYHNFKKKIQLCKQFECYKNMQDLLLQEPDKYFCSNYNWYYTGGNLTIEKICGIDFIFHTTNNTELSVSKLGRRNSNWTTKNQGILNNHDTDIYQLQSAVHGDCTLIGVRQKHQILLYAMKLNESESDHVFSELIHMQNTDIPFVSMCLNKQSHKEYEYALVNTKQKLQIFNLFALKPTLEYQVPYNIQSLEGDCFAQVSYYNNNLLTYINRTHFYIFDKRTNSISVNFQLEWNDIIKHQDRFVNICPNENNQLCYIATFNDILLLDVRFKSITSKYSHSFSSAPFISDFHLNNGNIFCISNYKPEEKLVLKEDKECHYIPVSLPTITDAFESSLLHSSNMSLCTDIVQRLGASTSGMKLWPNEYQNDSYTVFSANVLGDIYCHDITNTSKNEYFLKWSNHLLLEGNVPNHFDFVDKLVLNDISFAFDTEPEDFVSLIKTKRLQDCIQDLKKTGKGFSEKICDLWENVDQANVLNEIEEIPVDVSVRNWLIRNCNT